MSIYVAIPTLEDPEIENTLLEAVSKADSPEELHIGVAFITSQEYFIKVTSKFKEYTCFSFKLCDATKDVGVGIGRSQSYSMYAGEDYFLQIDSHTKFENGWDTHLVDLHKKAVKETGNTKTILTGYLEKYASDKNKIRTLVNGHTVPRYPFFVPGLLHNTIIPSWADKGKEERNNALFFEKDFLPCTKFNANFSFGNKEFALSTGLDKTVLFFEEELIQTVNLLNDGFSLVYPNQEVLLTHLYYSDSYFPRQSLDDLYGDSINVIEKMNMNYAAFMNEPSNKDKLSKFQRYTGVHPKYGIVAESKMPKSYIVD
jgi:hypothetical protein